MPFEFGQDEVVDRVLRPRLVGDRRHRRANRLGVGPMGCVLGPLLDPLLQDGDFTGGQLLPRLGWRHDFFGFRGDHTLNQRTVLRLADHEHFAF